jgi:hypothetical protein
MVVVVIVFRRYEGFLQTGRVMDAGNAESGSTIRSPRFDRALKKPARYAAVFFFARVCNELARYAMAFRKRVAFLLSRYNTQRLFQTEFLPICVNFCKLTLISVGSKGYYNYDYNRVFVRTYGKGVK